MKLLFFVRHYFDAWGGIEESIYQITKLWAHKYSIAVTSTCLDYEGPRRISNVAYISHNAVDIASYDRIIIENFNLFPHLPFLAKLMMFILTKRFTGRVIFVPHGGFTPYWQQLGFVQRRIKQLIHDTAGRAFINAFVSQTVAVSDWEFKELRKKGIRGPIAIIRNGGGGYCAASSDKELSFIFVGRIHPIKNIETIIEQFSYLLKDSRFSGYKLIIMGNYTNNVRYYEKLVESIKSKRIDDHVVFVGEQFDADKYAYVRKAQCLFCFSHWENDPIVVKEALSCGTKVCIQPNYGLADFIDEPNIFAMKDSMLNADEFYAFLQQPFQPAQRIPLKPWDHVASDYERVLS
jgi:glycosyltransferase involved in cell wall biosynthesis